MSDKQRYLDAMHGVQTATTFELALYRERAAASPKHLRVGINSAMVNDLALANLLIAKGIFALDEYEAALADAAEAELARFHAMYPSKTFV